MRGRAALGAVAVVVMVVSGCSGLPQQPAPASTLQQASASGASASPSSSPSGSESQGTGSPDETPLPVGSPIDIGIVGATAYAYPPGQVPVCTALTDAQVSAVLHGASTPIMGETIDQDEAHSDLCTWSAAGSKSSLDLNVVHPKAAWDSASVLARAKAFNKQYTAGGVLAHNLVLPGSHPNVVGWTSPNTGNVYVAVYLNDHFVLVTTHMFGSGSGRPVNTAALADIATAITVAG